MTYLHEAFNDPTERSDKLQEVFKVILQHRHYHLPLNHHLTSITRRYTVSHNSDSEEKAHPSVSYERKESKQQSSKKASEVAATTSLT